MKYFYAIVLGLMLLVSACAQQVQTTQKAGDAMEDKGDALKDKGDAMVEAKPSIEVNDQPVKDGVVMASKVTLDKPGFVVIHKVIDGTFADVIGNSELLEAGTYSNVEIELTDFSKETQLNAMLHYDNGDGSYEFPGPDGPTVMDDEVVMVFFEVGRAPTDKDIQILDAGNFDPTEMTINSGSTVTWINSDSKEAVIIIFKDGKTFENSNKIKPGEFYELELTEAGSYQYWRNVAFSSDGGMITVE